MTELQIGSDAPDFSLADQSGNDVSLSDYRGKGGVVLIFYPGDDTPGCTRQLCTVRDDYSQYQTAGVNVFGVNQAAAASHEQFISKYQLTTPLLVDEGLDLSRAYGAIGDSGRSIKRTVVGVDRDGKIAFYQHGMPSTEEILAAMRLW